jgi:hypothetical protein
MILILIGSIARWPTWTNIFWKGTKMSLMDERDALFAHALALMVLGS